MARKPIKTQGVIALAIIVQLNIVSAGITDWIRGATISSNSPHVKVSQKKSTAQRKTKPRTTRKKKRKKKGEQDPYAPYHPPIIVLYYYAYLAWAAEFYRSSTSPSFRLALSRVWAIIAALYIRPVMAVLFFKPPLGVVTAREVYRYVKRRSNAGGLLEEAEASGVTQKRTRHTTGRSFDLDASDRDYEMSGGVDPARAEVLRGAVEVLHARLDEKVSLETKKSRMWGSFSRKKQRKKQQKKGGSSSAPIRSSSGVSDADAKAVEYASAAAEVLVLGCPPKGSRLEFVERSAKPLSRLSNLFVEKGNMSPNTGSETGSCDEAILRSSAQLAQLRSVDALLRAFRDRLIQSSRRHARAEKQWKARVLMSKSRSGKTSSTGPNTRASIFGIDIGWARRNLVDDRRHYALAKAMTQRELNRLGQVQQHLMTRPSDLPISVLLDQDDIEDDKISNGARNSIIQRASDDRWSNEAKNWSGRGRRLIYELISHELSAAGEEKLGGPATSDIVGDALLELSEWSNTGKGGVDGEGWLSAVSLIHGISPRRKFIFGGRDLLAQKLPYWFNWADEALHGLPVSALFIALSLAVHNAIEPHWERIIAASKAFAKITYNVLERRFWRPFRDILLDLVFNARPRLSDASALADAEISLDNMLSDLNLESFGNVTEATRSAALEAASRLYEKQLNSGAIKNLIRGKMVRLLLIQVQQLKAEGLKAMELIDEIVDANRLNIQLLASIPAILLVFFGSKLFYSALYSIRSFDLGSIRNVHEEMSNYLLRLERCLLLGGLASANAMSTDSVSKPEEMDLASNEKETTMPRSQKGDPPATMQYKFASASSFSQPILHGAELGEFALLIHSYLLLLDYSSPPFPSAACDTIHHELQDLLSQSHVSSRRQLPLLESIRKRHEALARRL